MRSHALITCTKCITCAHILDKIKSHTHHSWSQSRHTQVRFFKKRGKTSLFFWLGRSPKNHAPHLPHFVAEQGLDTPRSPWELIIQFGWWVTPLYFSRTDSYFLSFDHRTPLTPLTIDTFRISIPWSSFLLIRIRSAGSFCLTVCVISTTLCQASLCSLSSAIVIEPRFTRKD